MLDIFLYIFKCAYFARKKISKEDEVRYLIAWLPPFPTKLKVLESCNRAENEPWPLGLLSIAFIGKYIGAKLDKLKKKSRVVCPKFRHHVQSSGSYLSGYNLNFCTGNIILQKL